MCYYFCSQKSIPSHHKLVLQNQQRCSQGWGIDQAHQLKSKNFNHTIFPNTIPFI